MGRRIPVSAPSLTDKEQRNVGEAIDSSWISSTGRFIDEFEAGFARLCESRACVTVCNGTIALHLAMLGLDLRPGDEVLVPSLTYVATANAVRYVGAEPVFVDIDPQTWCLDPAQIESRITKRTKGIIAVHLYGHPADMDAINYYAAIHGLWVVEDAAEAHGATYKGRPVGNLARLATFSFYGNKLMTSGEGGAVTVSDPSLEVRLRALRGQGVDPRRRYYFPITGYNFRLTNVAGALLCAQLERFDEMVAERRRIYGWYDERLRGVPGIGLQPVADWAGVAPWLYCITVDPKVYGRERDEVMADLEAADVETRPFFIPLHTLPPFAKESKARRERLPHTEGLASRGLNLPTFCGLTEDDVDRICEVISDGQR